MSATNSGGGEAEVVQDTNATPDVVIQSAKDFNNAMAFLRKQEVGHREHFITPYGRREILYADYAASGRSLVCIESMLKDFVMPHYANTHTYSSWTGQQSTHFREEARHLFRHFVNGNHEDAIIFTGNGATGASQKMIDILVQLSETHRTHDAVTATANSRENASFYDPLDFETSRWGSIVCKICSVYLKSDGDSRKHASTELHAARKQSTTTSPKESRFVVFGDPAAHHSTLLPLRKNRHFSFCPIKRADSGLPDLADLKNELTQLQQVESENEVVIPVLFLSHASNVTGIITDVVPFCDLVHSFSGVVVLDVAASLGHVKVDMNHPSGRRFSPDALLCSPHKLMGGPGCPGVLVVRKALLAFTRPAVVGGGVVHWVSDTQESIIFDHEHREEPGTPDVLGSFRLGAILKLYSQLSPDRLHKAITDQKQNLITEFRKKPRIQILGPNVLTSEIDSTNIISFMVKYGNDCKRVSVPPGSDPPLSNLSSTGGLYLHSHFVCQVLSDVWGVQARAGCACAGPLATYLLGMSSDVQRSMGACVEEGYLLIRPSFCRISLSSWMDFDDIDRIKHAVWWVAEYGWLLLPFYEMDPITGNWTSRLSNPENTRLWLSSYSLATKNGDLQFCCDGDKLNTNSSGDDDVTPKGPRKAGGVAVSDAVADELRNALLSGAKSRFAGKAKSSKPLPVKEPELTEFQKLIAARNKSKELASQKPSTATSPAAAPSPAVRIPTSPATASTTPVSADLRRSSSKVDSPEKKLIDAVDLSGHHESTPVVKDRVVSPISFENEPQHGATMVEASVPSVAASDDLAFSVFSRERCYPAPAEEEELIKKNEEILKLLYDSPSQPTAEMLDKWTRLPSQFIRPENANLLWFAFPADAYHSLKKESNFRNAVPEVMRKTPSSFWTGQTNLDRPINAPFEVLAYHGNSLGPESLYPHNATVKSICKETKRFWGGVVNESDDDDAKHQTGGLLPSAIASSPNHEVMQISKDEQEQLDNEFLEMIGIKDICDAPPPDKNDPNRKTIPFRMRRSVGQAMKKFEMVKEGDKILVALSGGKDSLAMLHVLLDYQKRLPISFELGVANVDPKTPEYDPSPLAAYAESLGLPFHSLSLPIVELAKQKMSEKNVSFCSFCARLKRGLLYSCMEDHGYTSLALGQHLDDIAESFMMSVFHNGSLNTMKAHYTCSRGLRVIRPLIYTRERWIAEFAVEAELPVIVDNCPMCFAAPKERHRMKVLLSEQEYLHENVFCNILKALEEQIGKTEVTIDESDNEDGPNTCDLNGNGCS
eukprot:GHVH01001483.1.p1 GENE.GHVH01001483.1~~GHVH01001483.1.p1  ORF type:complete len:1282 (-),score=180.56 GHVH01001483.1:59-3904(-)